MAWCTGLGSDIDAVWHRLLAGASAQREVESPHALRTAYAVTAPDVPTDLTPERRQLLMAGDTLARCLWDASLERDDARLVPVFGTSYGAHLDAPGTSSLSAWATQVAEHVGLIRPPITVSTACSAGSDTLLAALTLIRSGAADICVCGGVDVLTTAKRLGHSLLGTLSSDTLRAFDVRHDGTVLGEGAGFLVVESAASARARGARVHGLLSGAGSANDAAGSVAPDPSGRTVRLTVRRALRSGGLDVRDVAVVSAHGSGTPANDSVEAMSYGRLFGAAPAPPVVFATKGAFGHSLGATGALEAITVIQALKAGQVPPVHGLHDVVAELPLPVPAGRPMPLRGGCGLSVTLGFGGFNTCLLFEGASDVVHG
ncbi:beta-ketoacyl-[acyl-carrier-protein] synthase family protein [Streptomyces sp. GMR22]|nr:beta-ketoacyl-[acyl-carrier-protein] synthase family protein [Streptomyces sp. GMR22]